MTHRLKSRLSILLDLENPGRNLSLTAMIFLFMGGAVVGSLFAAAITAESGQALLNGIQSNLSIAKNGQLAAVPFWESAINQIKYPLLVFIMGFSIIGTLLIPFGVAAKGFFLSYTVTSYVRMLGVNGLWFALAYEGLQSAVVLPAFLLLAADGFANALSIFSISTGMGKRLILPPAGKTYFLRALFCLAFILAAILAEAYLSPRLVLLSAKYLW